ncbi:MAG: PIN domain-containing protein [Candidatus Omnitrophica bacterium]|nr:PIN domain-containing protein [Candidatus Omnitrophota bacterium]
MKISRIYIDTSVIGGCFDKEFAPWSNGLMKDFRLGHFRPIVSQIVDAELINAPEHVKRKYAELIDLGAEILVVDERVDRLVSLYRKSNILSDKFENDMAHIALATVYEIDILVSWNFKHIVHFDKIRQFNIVNEKARYKSVQIYSPREVSNYEENI